MMGDLPGFSALYGLFGRLRSLGRGLLGRAEFESEMDEEFRHHLELRTEHLVREGHSREEAGRRARLEFGHIDSHKEDARASRGLRLFDEIRFSWLDVKLGFRILARYPGLTVVGCLGMAFAIFVGSATFEFVDQMVDPELPLPDGDRIVGLRYWDAAENEEALPLPSDLRVWREEMGSVRQLGAFRSAERNLAVGGVGGEPVNLAQISPVGFRVTGVRPLLGRTLVQTDEDPEAPPVVVLGYRIWQARFAGDPDVLGRTVRLGDLQPTVVGVMPEGFSFPRDHELWTPLRPDDRTGDPDSGAPVRVFGRLAPGATLNEAQAEAATIASRPAQMDGGRSDRLTPEVLPYAESLMGVRIGLLMRALIYQLNVFAALLLILVSANVALLMFARAATREREMLVRSALGASRKRLLTQLFVEALVLAAVSTVLGLAATGPALEWLLGMIRDMGGGPLPFWFAAQISPSTAVYAGMLALLGAIVAGVTPALKVTGRSMQVRLRQAGAGAGGLRLGGIWTAVIVTQIAATVIFAGVAYVFVRQAGQSASMETNFAAEQYLGVRVEIDRENFPSHTNTTEVDFLGRYSDHVQEFKRRVAEDPAIAGVTLAERLPLKVGATSLIELDGAGAAPLDSTRAEHVAYSDAVDLDYFEVFRAPVLAGRGFDSRDLRQGANTVIVNASFVQEVLGGRAALGRRVRYVDADRPEEPGQWHEIVGVVRDLAEGRTRSLDLEDHARGRIYYPLSAAHPGSYPLHLIAHAPGGLGALTPTLYRTAEAVHPALRLHEPQTLDRVNSDLAVFWRLWADLVLTVSGVALFLSLAGIYAVMSFTVARRRREIGVRVALGARATRVVVEIFRRPLSQIAAGVALGCALLGAIVWGLTDGRASTGDAALLLALGVGMAGICALACIGPTLRALRVEPIEALSADM